MEKNPVQITIDKWIEGWNKHNVEKVIENYVEDGEIYDPKIKELMPDKRELFVKGKGEIKDYLKTVFLLFPDIEIKPVGLWIKNKVGGFEAILEYFIYPDKNKKAYTDAVAKFFLDKENKIKGEFIYYGLGYTEKE